jgi:hypothetical protein
MNTMHNTVEARIVRKPLADPRARVIRQTNRIIQLIGCRAHIIFRVVDAVRAPSCV